MLIGILSGRHTGAQPRLVIDHPAINADGRQIAFDFHFRLSGGAGSTRKAIAIYQITTGELEVHLPPPPRSFHSPDFSASGQEVAVVQLCWRSICPWDERGHQLGIINRRDRSFVRLTSNGDTHRWNSFHRYKKDYLEPRLDETTNRLHFRYVKRHLTQDPASGSKLRVRTNLAVDFRNSGYIDLDTGTSHRQGLDGDRLPYGSALARYDTYKGDILVRGYSHARTAKGGIDRRGTPDAFGYVLKNGDRRTSDAFPRQRRRYERPKPPTDPKKADPRSLSAGGTRWIFSLNRDGDRHFGIATPGRKTGILYVGQGEKIIDALVLPVPSQICGTALSDDGTTAVVLACGDSANIWVADIGGRRFTPYPIRDKLLDKTGFRMSDAPAQPPIQHRPVKNRSDQPVHTPPRDADRRQKYDEIRPLTLDRDETESR